MKKAGSFALIALALALASCRESPTETTDGTRITFSNMSQFPMISAAFSDCDDLSGFGPNRLRDDLPPGEHATFETRAGCWDLEAVLSDGRKFHDFEMRLQRGEHGVFVVR